MAGGIYSGLGRGIQNALDIFLSLDAQEKDRKRQAQLDEERRAQNALDAQLAREGFELQKKNFEADESFRNYQRTRQDLQDLPLTHLLAPNTDLYQRAQSTGLGHMLDSVNPTVNGSIPVGMGLSVPNITPGGAKRRPTAEEQLRLETKADRDAAIAALPENVRAFAKSGIDPSLQFGVEDPKVKDAREHQRDLEKIAAQANAYQDRRTPSPEKAEFDRRKAWQVTYAQAKDDALRPWYGTFAIPEVDPKFVQAITTQADAAAKAHADTVHGPLQTQEQTPLNQILGGHLMMSSRGPVRQTPPSVIKSIREIQ